MIVFYMKLVIVLNQIYGSVRYLILKDVYKY